MIALKATKTLCGIDKISPVYQRVDQTGEDFLTNFKSNFSIKVISESPMEMVFEMKGIDAPFANAFRRILLSEVPSIAIETCYFSQNTSIIPDEILSHRLGLIPLNIDAQFLEFHKDIKAGEFNDTNTIVFDLDVEGKPANVSDLGAFEGDDDIQSMYTNVYASDLKFRPIGDQLERFGFEPAPVDGDILLAKLAPGQQIKVECFAVKGLGIDHAKFSPVCTASYRLMPHIEISSEKPITGKEAEDLVKICPLGVYDIEDLGKGKTRAVAARPIDCTLCRECIRPPEFADRIRLERVNDHFIFSIESVGAMPPRTLFLDALAKLQEKAKEISDALYSDYKDTKRFPVSDAAIVGDGTI